MRMWRLLLIVAEIDLKLVSACRELTRGARWGVGQGSLVLF